MATPVESRLYAYTVYHGIAWYGMAVLAGVLLTLCSLLAGLTLALGGLDITWLQLRSATGTAKQRQQALVVAKIKSHSTWMLCSLIISSVICGESLPFVIQSLWHGNQQWGPILVSTFSMALFAEILPQYAIPRQAISWAYYCWPLIWSCMWLTAIVSYPLAWILDSVAGRKHGHGLFTNDEMAAVIKYHELSEHNGGTLSPDAARVMLGALRLDSRKIGGDIALIPEKSTDDEKDLEKADLVVLQGLIVQWSAVKIINIDDVVDEAFIAKVSGWSYSRIPVIGDPEPHEMQGDPAVTGYGWEGKQIFGFLHVKNLVGLDVNDKRSSTSKVYVRDLPLYPLPIVYEDMSVYNLLSIFQLGMSRMAVVVPRPLKTSQAAIGMSLKNENECQTLRWTATPRPNDPAMWCGDEVDGSTDHFTQSNIEKAFRASRDFADTMSPKPIGIVTFEDIVDAILQKTSRDENDFFCRGNMPPPTKSKKAADYIKFTCNYVQKELGISTSPRKPASFQPPVPPTLRRRNISNKMLLTNKPCAMDGAYELSIDSAAAHSPELCKMRKNSEETAYTRSGVDSWDAPVKTRTLSRSSSPVKIGSLPSRKAIVAVLPDGSTCFWRRVSAAPRLPQLQRVTPFSRQSFSSYEKRTEDRGRGNDKVNLIAPVASTSVLPKPLSTQASMTCSGDNVIVGPARASNDARVSSREDSQEVMSLISWCPGGLVDVDKWNAQLCDSFTVTAGPVDGSHTSAPSSEALTDDHVIEPQPYQGFPPELLDLPSSRKENHFLNHPASTLPRMNGPVVDIDILAVKHDGRSKSREDSFQHDRALLPTQRKFIDNSGNMTMSGARSSSFWF